MDFLSFPDSRYEVKHMDQNKNISISSAALNEICHPQGYPYFVPPYGYPQQRNNVVLQPNNGQVAQQNLERTTQRPQLPLQVRHARFVLIGKI